MIKTPLGAVLDLFTPHNTHFQASIREACRYACIQGLTQRNSKGEEPQRKDMVGIAPHIDLNATMAMLNSKKDKSDPDQEEEGYSKLASPHKLGGKDRRRMQTIIAGSIRAPHRLKHAGKVSSDICTHP